MTTPDISLSDFQMDKAKEEFVGRLVRVNIPTDKTYHQRKGKIGGVYRSEKNEPVDAYWIFFEDWKLDLWFLPTELQLIN